MPLASAAAAAAASAGVGTSVFGYNRENFLYDRKMRQETEYQIMDFRIKQAELWREDVRDIIGLTSVKMDTYLIVNAVQLGFTVAAFCEGRLATGTPSWLVGCHTLSLAGAFMYLLMSVWFSMHASVTAKSYEVRLLTQLVRLPVPSWSQLEGARTYASGFEKTDTKQMFRVPFAMGTQEGVLGQAASAESRSAGLPMAAQPGQSAEAQQSVGSADLWGLEGRGDKIYELDGGIRTNPDAQQHLQLIKQVMHYWQSYDGFARVAMSMGTNQLIMGLSYYVIAYVLISNKAIIASFLVVLLFMVIATALIRLDMSLTGLEFRTAATFVMAGPCITALAAQQWRQHTVRGFEVVHILAPLPYAFSAGWLMLLLYIARVEQQEGGAMLPTGFRSVMYIDVFGWMKRSRGMMSDPPNVATDNSMPTPAATAMMPPPTSGVGPAVQTVNYTGCLFKSPSPTRPEQLAGAPESPRHDLATKEMFDPTTFVPRENDDEGKPRAEHDVQPYLRPGFAPWRIFCSATAMLIFLWWLSGVLVLLQASGWTALRIAPLLREEGGEHTPHALDEGHGASFMVMEPGSIGKVKRSFMQVEMHSATHLMGERLDTHWPHLAGAPPRHLACGMDADDKTTVVAASRFGLFLSQLEPALKGRHGYKLSPDSNSSATFQYAPACDDLDGEAVQDVSMMCGGKEGHCQALVLHRQGQRLAACGLSTSKASEPTTGRDALPGLMSLSDRWLGEGDAAANQPQEEVESIAMAGRCSGADPGQCAFAETTNGRLVEFKTGLSKDSGSTAPDWYPSRVLLADASSKARAGGTLHMLGNGYVGVLAKDGKELRAVDPRSGSKVVGHWQLPAERRWTSMCSSAGSLYLLSEGNLVQPPQLYRFPLPASLYDDAVTKPTNDEASAVKPKQWASAVQTRKHGYTSRDHVLATAMS